MIKALTCIITYKSRRIILLLKDRLGHASLTTTIDTYSHLYLNKQEKSLANKLDDLF